MICGLLVALYGIISFSNNITKVDYLGNLLAKMRTQPDTVYLPSKEVVVTLKEKVPYPVEKELTRWQQFRLDVGGWSIGIICIGLLVFVIRFIIKRLN